jgi:hypothetical protein
MMADIICQEANERVRRVIQELDDGEFITTDERLMTVAEKIFETKGYCAEHPLKRNIW